jgi:hypothetical protein
VAKLGRCFSAQRAPNPTHTYKVVKWQPLPGNFFRVSTKGSVTRKIQDVSLPIHVDAYAGYRADERPRRFELDGVEYSIYAWERERRTPDSRCFLVRAEGKRYVLSCDEQSGEWTLQSELDGAELLARPNIEFVAVGPEAIREAELRIAGCERFRGDEAFQPFDWILADALGKPGAFEFILAEAAGCTNCGNLGEDARGSVTVTGSERLPILPAKRRSSHPISTTIVAFLTSSRLFTDH